MPDRVSSSNQEGQTIRVHTQQIVDSCLNQDCVEDLRVYLTRDSQDALDNATGAKARCCELIYAQLDVESIPYNCGHYTVDVTYYYRVTGDINTSGLRTCALCGLAVFSKRVVLYGGSGSAKSFSSRESQICSETILRSSEPEAITEVVDPMILAAKVVDSCDRRNRECTPDIPTAILDSFGEELVLNNEGKQLYITIGQFSTIRLERDSQLEIPYCRYSLPTKECCEDPGCAEEPCDIFSRIAFPIDAFFPTDNGNDCNCSE